MRLHSSSASARCCNLFCSSHKANARESEWKFPVPVKHKDLEFLIKRFAAPLTAVLLAVSPICNPPDLMALDTMQRSSAENSRRPETVAVELSLSLLRRLSSLLSLSPARSSLSPRRRTLSLSSAKVELIGHGIARMIDEWIMMHKNPHTDKWDSMN
uniref:Uncharacterized protein n=1 Tax=Brassica oleracea var. oleracea TaxID=109376 RepID=A0A0D3AU64_BRAOL